MKKNGERQFRWGYSVYVLFMLTILGFLAAGIISLFTGIDVDSLSGNVALISIDGVITGSESDYLFEGTSSSEDIVELIEEADGNDNIKAIILEINSPGGSAVASEEIANAVKKTNKTTVAWIREVGASGAYWIASASDHVVANRVSITGSIGVIASYLEFPGLLEEYNITYRRLVAGKYKDLGTPFREMTKEEEDIFQKDLDVIRGYFVSEVAENRGMSEKEIDKVANGLFYLGVQAKELGLVDELGGKDEVIRYIEEREDIEAEIVEYQKEATLFDILSGVMSRNSFFVGRGIGSVLFDKRAASAVEINT